jgi:hypothetical protein
MFHLRLCFPLLMGTPKKRAATLQEKFGFCDDDMKSPQHDRIMLWLDGHAEELVREYFAMPREWPEERIAEVRAQADAFVKKRFSALGWQGLGEPPARKFQIASKTWEKTIVARNGFTVGFADMEVVVRFSSDLSFSCSEEPTLRTLPRIEWSVEINQEHVIFEAKTSIGSVGEVIRQIRLYQQHQPGHYVLVSPDDRFADLLRSQDIQFVKYEEKD